MAYGSDNDSFYPSNDGRVCTSGFPWDQAMVALATNYLTNPGAWDVRSHRLNLGSLDGFHRLSTQSRYAKQVVPESHIE